MVSSNSEKLTQLSAYLARDGTKLYFEMVAPATIIAYLTPTGKKPAFRVTATDGNMENAAGMMVAVIAKQYELFGFLPQPVQAHE